MRHPDRYPGAPANTRDAGLTLLEITIATAIMGMAFVLLFGSFINMADLGASTQKRTVAQSQLSTILENVRLLTYDQLKAYTPPAPQGLGASATAQVQCYTVAGAALTLPVAAATVFPNPVEVRVTITWRDDRGRLSSLRESALFRR
ncbi:MAG: type II secretion system protein [Candidatus Hydrogenedentes bacterium]|nr:type II secretion system protein [Candidatus Hydrogenedentota bacterium]